jgi:Flp pilus assembly protein TadD
MRTVALLLVVMVGACAGPARQDLANRPPSLTVAHAALTGGAPAVALKICADTVQREPKNAAAYVCEGDALAALGQRGEAETAFKGAQQVDPGNVDALMGLGRLALATDPVAAEGMFQHVVALQGGNAAAWNDTGIARDLQDRHRQAQEAYGQALGLEPSMRAAEVNMALSLAMSGQADEAVRRLRAIAGDPSASPRVRQDLAAVLAMADKPEEAARLLRGELTPDEIDQAIAGYRALSAPPAK